MSKCACLLLILFLFASSCIIFVGTAISFITPPENSWVSKAPMQEARGGLGTAVVNGRIYAIGGSTEIGYQPNPIISGGVVKGSNEEYNPASDSWTSKAPMPTPRASFAVAAYKNKIYCIGGITDDGYSKVNEVYDPLTDSWETKASMPTARAALQANVVNGKIYLIGGYPNANINEVYDPESDSWTTKAPMPYEASAYASAVVNDKVYVIGGFNASRDLNLNQIYDTKADKWTYGAPPPKLMYGWTGGSAAAATTGIFAPKRI